MVWTGIMLRMIVVCVVLLGAACWTTAGATTETRTRTALDVLREVIDPAYALATDACAARALALTAQLKAQAISIEEGKQQRNALDKRCDPLLETFEQMRLAHDKAATLVEEGQIAEAERLVAELRQRWRTLKGGP